MTHIYSAPGKLILCGEHAVVYSRPAIALPLSQIRATAVTQAQPAGSGLSINAPDLGRRWDVAREASEPLSALALRAIDVLAVALPDVQITLRSQIPIASGLGSGAAIATALVRALAGFCGVELMPAQISALVYESECHYHGTPSGIDNTVVAYECPLWYRRGDPQPTIELFGVGASLSLVIGDTGIRSATRLPVGEVRRRWQQEPERYEALFDHVAATVVDARAALEDGNALALGRLLDINHDLLIAMGVSSPELDHLVAAARAAGALGAKLSGGGWGGVMLALVRAGEQGHVAEALRSAGAARVLTTTLG